MAEFTFTPSYTTAVAFKPRVRIAEYGDGYSQRAVEGLNPISEVWELIFDIRQDSTTDDILLFLADHVGQAFMWTPPGRGLPIRVMCNEWQRTFTTNNLNGIRATFTQVFDLV